MSWGVVEEVTAQDEEEKYKRETKLRIKRKPNKGKYVYECMSMYFCNDI